MITITITFQKECWTMTDTGSWLFYIKLHVGDRGGVVIEHQTLNRKVLGSIPTGSFRLLWISEDFSCSSFFVFFFLLNVTYLALNDI